MSDQTGEHAVYVPTACVTMKSPCDLDRLMDVLVAWQQGGGSPAPDGIRALAALVWRVRAGG